MIVVCSYNAGNHRIQTALTAALHQYNPALIVFAGVGGGIGSKVQVGSVVISDHIADVSYLIEKADDTAVVAKGGPVDARLVNLANQVKEEGAWLKRMKEPSEESKEEMKPEIVIGKVCAGNTLVTTETGLTGKFLAAAGPDTHVIEMESGACFDAAFVYKTPYITVRGVSDKLTDKDPNTDLYRQPWAAAYASAAAFELIHLFIYDSKSAEVNDEAKKIATEAKKN